MPVLKLLSGSHYHSFSLQLRFKYPHFNNARSNYTQVFILTEISTLNHTIIKLKGWYMKQTDVEMLYLWTEKMEQIKVRQSEETSPQISKCTSTQLVMISSQHHKSSSTLSASVSAWPPLVVHRSLAL